MKRYMVAAMALPLAAAQVLGGQEPLMPQSVLAVMKHSADWQLAHSPKHTATDWTHGAYYAGMMALAGMADTPKYHDAMMQIGRRGGWKLGRRVYQADDHCVGAAWCEMYTRHKDPAMIAPVLERLDAILAKPSAARLDFKTPGNQDRWSWCDALFMAPPVWAAAAKATGEAKYIEFMNKEWWGTTDFLYDKDEHLYFRDSTYFNRREGNGRKIFWGRGNGWALAGLARVLQHMPADYAHRSRYETLFKEMAAKVLSLQQADGLWRSSLLDPAGYPLKETSGSGFFCFALAWGVNNGLLDRATYESAVRKAWAALADCVDADGKLTHVQPIGADPKKFDPTSTEVYGVGALLLAGSEVYRLLGGATPASQPATAQTAPQTRASATAPADDETLDVAQVCSEFPVRFCLLTHGRRQYVAYYDAQRRMTVAARDLDSRTWQYQVLPQKVGWDSHNSITMAIDEAGQIHLAGNMHCVPLVYFRTSKGGDIATFKQVKSMTGQNEKRCTYPRFMRGAQGQLIFRYRDGSSGNGNEIMNVYDAAAGKWKRLLDAPLLDGRGKMNAYSTLIHRGEWFHLAWVWRDTPDCQTAHDPSYARSRDLVHWETADGKSLKLPITAATTGTRIDAIPIKGGLLGVGLGFDSQSRPLATYYKFDPAGKTQAFVARFDEGRWTPRQVSDWEHRWQFSGGGSIETKISLGGLRPLGEGKLGQSYSHWKHGKGVLVIDEQTLKPLGVEKEAPARSSGPAQWAKPESTFPGMTVQWFNDIGESSGGRYVLRWETLPPNRDQPRKGPLPKPSMLRVLKLRS
ncbi:MAG: glycoside hydrolase family 88 protein [Planctomycetaceae bacterium]|nr:glycoside hydrolase family 88 protein [Planctomycetaceae bacterium]